MPGQKCQLSPFLIFKVWIRTKRTYVKTSRGTVALYCAGFYDALHLFGYVNFNMCLHLWDNGFSHKAFLIFRPLGLNLNIHSWVFFVWHVHIFHFTIRLITPGKTSDTLLQFNTEPWLIPPLQFRNCSKTSNIDSDGDKPMVLPCPHYQTSQQHNDRSTHTHTFWMYE